MRAKEACEASPYENAVRYTVEGQPMIYSTKLGRMFQRTTADHEEPSFKELKSEYVADYCEYNDWQPWAAPLLSQAGFFKQKAS